jgi:hypothetical protein
MRGFFVGEEHQHGQVVFMKLAKMDLVFLHIIQRFKIGLPTNNEVDGR